ncbi:MAG TPA: hypothetical protein PKI20_06810 [Verrucomicrobiota bacterium]|nr:hypothetical protein [Verrucomicrobiota bacterium]
MKLLATPRTGSLGRETFYQSPFGLCARERTVPSDKPSNRKAMARSHFGVSSREWGVKLTEAQRQRWNTAALNVPSQPWMGQYSHLSGQQFCVQVNSTLRCIGQAPVLEPPAPVVFAPSPVTGLEIVNDAEEGVRLLLNVGTVNEDIMVFGQPPCSAGRMKHRRVYYLGLLGPASNGQCDITALYTARFGQPTPGQKVFIVTSQTKNGWKGVDSMFSAIVPPPPESKNQQVTEKKKVTKAKSSAAPESATARVQVSSSLPRSVYKGSTRDARGEHKRLKRVHPVSIPCTPVVHGLLAALRRLGGLWRIGTAGASAC